MRYELNIRPEPFQGYTQFDEMEMFDTELVDEQEQEVSSISEYAKWVQNSLNKIMNLNLAVDGDIGPQTRSAVRSFQQQRGLLVDGIVGTKTEETLQLAGAPPPPGKSGITLPTKCTPLTKPCDVLDNFDHDKDSVRPSHQPQIINISRCVIASQSSSDPIRSVRIVGHASAEGSDQYNLDLGRRRAEQVKRQLRDTIERIKPGSSTGINFAVETQGENNPVSTNAASNRRVEICLPPKVIRPPTPPLTPQVTDIKIVVKSFIMPIGLRVGSTACGIPFVGDPKLAVLAAATDLSFSENPPTDIKNKIYRLFSARTFRVTSLNGRLISVTPSPTVDTDFGLECDPARVVCLSPPPLTTSGISAGASGASTFDFAWTAKGRPNLAAEPAFQLVCPRISFFIWHRINGRIDCSGPTVKVFTTLNGSRFPTHRLYVNGAIRTSMTQGNFSNLWVPTPSDPTLVL